MAARVALGALGSAVLAGLCHATDPADAPEGRAASSAPAHLHVAAARIESEQEGRGTRRQTPEADQHDLELLLAQVSTPEPAQETGDTILAAFPISTPAAVDEEVAAAHGLEIVRRVTLEALARRIVVYRLKSPRPAHEVLAALMRDARVTSAQLNARYTPTPPTTPRTAAGNPPAAATVPQAKQPAKGITAERKGRAAAAQPRREDGASAARDPQAIAAKPARAAPTSGSLVANKHAAMRWPTADEPFVNVGVNNR